MDFFYGLLPTRGARARERARTLLRWTPPAATSPPREVPILPQLTEQEEPIPESSRTSTSFSDNIYGAIDIKISGGKYFFTDQKVYVVYNLVKTHNAKVAASSQLYGIYKRPGRNTAAALPDRDGTVRWKHKRSFALDSEEQFALKLECYNKRNWRRPIGTALIPLISLIPGKVEKKTVRLRYEDRDIDEIVHLSVRFMSPQMDQYRASIRDMHEDEAVEILRDVNDPLFPNIMLKLQTKTRSLHACAKFNWTDLTRMLLKKGAKIDSADKLGRTPLMIACTNTSTEVAHILLEHHADVQLRDISHFGLLHYACKGENVALVQELLDRNCDPSQASHNRKTPLHFAAELGHLDQVKLLLDHNVFVDSQMEMDSATPLVLAVKNKHRDCASLLLEAGANVNHSSTYTAPIVTAINNNDCDMAQLLLKPKYHCNLLRYHQQALHKAAELGSLDLLQLIVPHKPSNLQTMYNGSSCLHSAIKARQPQAVSYLLSQSANPNLLCGSYEDMQNVSPLILAARLGDRIMASVLVNEAPSLNPNQGCSWDLYQCDQVTALHISVLIEDIETLRVLMTHSDIKISLKTKTRSTNPRWNGQTPADLAFRQGLREFARTLRLTPLRNEKIQHPASSHRRSTGEPKVSRIESLEVPSTPASEGRAGRSFEMDRPIRKKKGFHRRSASKG